jgi:RHS repeat-associated protein
LGNTRITFTKIGSTITKLQEDHYYPFGMNFAGVGASSSSIANKYKYNGKELQADHGLNWYDYGARFYDPQIGRWHVPDPLEQYFSPYIYVNNNPTNFVDSDGMWGQAWTTSYVDERGNELLNTDDGSDMIVTVPDEFVDEFWKNVKNITNSDNPDFIDSREWNFGMKSSLLGIEWNQALENNQSWWRTDDAKRNAALFIQTGDWDYFSKAVKSHTGSMRDPVSMAAGIAGGLYVAAALNTTIAKSMLRNGHLAGKVHPKTGVPFTRKGFPNFKKHLYKGGINDVRIKPTGSRASDVMAANKSAGYSSTPKGHVWHHHQTTGRMQLVEGGIHRATGHTGGFSLWD